MFLTESWATLPPKLSPPYRLSHRAKEGYLEALISKDFSFFLRKMQRVLSGNVRSLSSEALIIQRPRKNFAPPSTAKKSFFFVKGLPFFLLRFFAFDKQIISVKIRYPPFANKKSRGSWYLVSLCRKAVSLFFEPVESPAYRKSKLS